MGASVAAMRRPARKYGRAAGSRSSASSCSAGGAVHLKQVHHVRFGGQQSLGRVHHDGKEADEERDGDDARQTGAGPQDDDRARATITGVICRMSSQG